LENLKFIVLLQLTVKVIRFVTENWREISVWPFGSFLFVAGGGGGRKTNKQTNITAQFLRLSNKEYREIVEII